MKLVKQFCNLVFGLLAVKPIVGERFGFEFINGLFQAFRLEEDLFENVLQGDAKGLVQAVSQLSVR